MKLILSTSNIMGGGPSVMRKPMNQKSNVELVNSLRANFELSQFSEPRKDGSPADATAPMPSSKIWTTVQGDRLFIPSHQATPLNEPRPSYDVTCKLFYLPGVPASRRCAHTKEAISLVLKELGIASVDLLILSFPGISFDADDDGKEENVSEDDGSHGEADGMDTILKTWRTLEKLHEEGIISQLGLAEFSSERLATFLPHTKIRPSVDQINVLDCCVVPKTLIMYAKQESIQLLTHNDCTDILPSGTTRELLATYVADKFDPEAADTSDGIKGEIEAQWVIKYTAVVKDRGVIENKGYFAMAQVGD